MDRIKEGMKLPANKHGRVEIPNVDRRMIPSFLKSEGCEVGVEIGVQRASYTKRFADVGLKIYGVDPWLSYPDYFVNDGYQDKQNILYQIALDNMAKYPNCTLIRKTSMDALEDFEEESIDFVYIDGHHGFKYVTEDIFEWSKKVKRDGFIMGHDYAYSPKPKHFRKPYILQVKWVVDAYVQAMNIERWYVLGAARKTFEGEKRDSFRTWMWQKTWKEEI